jgi:hypothetical protein
MAKKKSWSEWAHAWVRKTGKCPGSEPAFGLPTALMTEDEFEDTMRAVDLHKWNNCHFGSGKDAVDPINAPPQGSKRLFVKDSSTPAEAHQMLPYLDEVMDSQRVVSMKKNLHVFVDRISLKDGEKLVIPEPLLNIREYVEKFFELK